ncbi:MAG: hypothetical protein ABR98_04640 [Cryomorphaceae bacterium BACL7 MAG-120910-bin2]|nr:MAG: hypothetical protein ABR98_04640 [Cryomorphaceae bacterium BACL7 MAG-120910-bin2]KRO68550.1 MAG: hypothetical protein ABR88_00200 [Cryomorphaceae bacterium BACL7 MAG-120322-bin74]KRO83948.1 MAG: hypothetical protein ABR87_05475 [Cryomorphaceae bacterium BACL7 MAG-121220-bin83]NQW26009.1 hypothetical protein [Cryomorphaceae bacterium]
MPNITLGTNTPGLGRPEIFPWAGFYAVRKDIRLTIRYTLFLGYITLSAALFFLQGNPFIIPLRSLMALVNASVIFFTIIRVQDEEFDYINKAFLWVFAANVFVSLLQTFHLFPPSLVRTMNFFIERWEPTAWENGRGSGGLFAEPSYYAFGVHHYFAYALLLFKVDQRSRLGLILTAAMAVYDLTVIRSLTGLIIMVIYVISHQDWRKAWKGALAILMTGLAALYFYGQSNDLPRGLEFVYNVFFEQRYKDLFTYVTWEGGIRTVSLLASYPFGIFHPFGWGIGSWPAASITALLDMGLSEIEVAFFEQYTPYDGFRPTAYSADLFLEAGVVGWLLFAGAMYPYVINAAMWKNPNTRAVVVLFLFNMLILGTIGDPLPFLFLALAYRSIHPPPLITKPIDPTPHDTDSPLP